jgi:ABC-type multidrug transport system ATPase subunit
LNYFNQQVRIPQEKVYQNVVIATPYMELIEEFTLEEMIKFHFKFKKILKGYSHDELIEILELGHARTKQISNFSSGMRQRLKLGLAFYSDTTSLFLDEPTTNLDKKSIEWYQTNLKDTGATRLVLIASNASHEYPEEALKVDLLTLK